jgi:hypothetical protein
MWWNTLHLRRCYTIHATNKMLASSAIKLYPIKPSFSSVFNILEAQEDVFDNAFFLLVANGTSVVEALWCRNPQHYGSNSLTPSLDTVSLRDNVLCAKPRLSWLFGLYRIIVACVDYVDT